MCCRLVAIAATLLASLPSPAVPPPPTFVDVHAFDPRIETSERYATKENLTGDIVPGGREERAILTEQAARAPSRAQDLFERQGYRLLVYDAYLPASSVRGFVAWSREPSAERERRRYFPTIAKAQLLPLGYIG
jgi:D-alanyl-D-alanine dipeptidase